MTTYTLWSQAAETVTATGAGNAGTVGLHFTVNQQCTLNGIWIYSPSGQGMAGLPSTIGLYNYSTQALIHSEAVSGWSAGVGTGWVYAAFSSPPTVSSGTDYLAAAYLNSTSAWFVYDQPYTWPASNGPITAPKDTGTGQGWYDNVDTTAIHFPTQQLAGYNWWLDVSVTPTAVTSTGSVSLAAMAAQGSGTVPVTSTGSVSLASMSVHGTVADSITSSGSVSLAAMAAHGAGTVPVTSTGSISLSSMSAAGNSVVTSTVHGTVPGGKLATSGSVLVALSNLAVAGSAHGGRLRTRGALAVGTVAPPPSGPLQPPVVNNWLSGNAVDAPSLNTYVRDTFTYLANPPLLRMQQNAQQKGIQPASWTVVTLQQKIEDTYSGWWPSTLDGNGYQAQVPGWYSLTLNVTADVPSGSLGRVGFWYWSAANSVWVGPIEFGQQVVGPGASYWTWHAYDETYLQVDDFVFPVFYHQAGVSVNTDLSSPSTFELTWISS